MDPLQETVEMQLKRPRGPSFLLEQLERGQVAMRPGYALNTKCGSYKDDRTSNHVDVFSIERGRKRTYKGFQYFCQGHDREGGNLVEHFFSCLIDILFRTSHWTISNYSLLNTRLIEVEYSRRG